MGNSYVGVSVLLCTFSLTKQLDLSSARNAQGSDTDFSRFQLYISVCVEESDEENHVYFGAKGNYSRRLSIFGHSAGQCQAYY